MVEIFVNGQSFGNCKDIDEIMKAERLQRKVDIMRSIAVDI